MAKSKYREKQERGLVPSRYPAQMKGAWQHWPRHVDGPKSMAAEGRNDARPRPLDQSFIEPHHPIYAQRDATRARSL